MTQNRMKFGKAFVFNRVSARLFIAPLLLVTSACTMSQEVIEYRITGGVGNELCETYRNDLSEATNTSIDGSLEHHVAFHGFEEISSIPFRRMQGVLSFSSPDISTLSVDIDNNGDTEQLFQSVVLSITERNAGVEGYRTFESLSIYFTEYPKMQGSDFLPDSTVPYTLRNTDLNPWEDVIGVQQVVEMRSPRTIKDFKEDYDPFNFVNFSRETTTFIYTRDSMNFFSINKYNMATMDMEEREGGSYYVKQSLLAKYSPDRQYVVICVIDSTN